MDLNKYPLIKRVSIAKSVWFVIGLIWFTVLSYMSIGDVKLRLAVLFWYTTLGWVLWLFWVMDYHPVLRLKMKFWFRWIFFWAWMNFVLMLFISEKFTSIMVDANMPISSPYWLILEWVIIWFVIDFVATKYWGEWKNLYK